MSPFKFPCQNCGQRLSAFEDQIGTTELCPRCGAMVKVVAPRPPPIPPPEDAAAKTPFDEKAGSKTPETKPQKAISKAAPLVAAAHEAGKNLSAGDAGRLATGAAPARNESRAPSRKPPIETKRSDRAAVSGSHPLPAPSDRFHCLVQRIQGSRYLTISFLLHFFVVMTLGGTVLYHVAPKEPDFVAGGTGMLVEENVPEPPPEASPPGQSMAYQFAPQASVMSVPISSVITTVQLTSNVVKIAPMAPRGLSDSMKGALSALDSRRNSPVVSSVGSGTAGGTRWATIFGRRIMASRLGVILDFSASAYPHLAGAVDEIQRGFSDAILILYPGCGMVQFEGNPEHEIRKFSSISAQEIEAIKTDYNTTGSQIWSASKVSGFAEMTNRASVKDTLFVSWYAPKFTSWAKLIGRTQVVFDDLMKRKVDAIYWFSDFEDPVDPRVLERLAVDLKTRRIKLHLHNFGDSEINPDIRALAEKSGGTISVKNAGN